jgi:hypothetical protein
MRCEEESITTFQSLGGRLTSLDGIKIQKESLLRFIYECSMKDATRNSRALYQKTVNFFNLIFGETVVKIAKMCEFDLNEDVI